MKNLKKNHIAILHDENNNYTGQQKKCQGLKISYFPNFGALIPNLTIIFKFMEPILQCCQFSGFFDQKSRFRIFFENLKNSETFFFVIGKRIKLSAVCKKKIIEIGPTDLEISRFEVKKSSKFRDFLKKIFFRFVVKSRLDLKK